MVFLVVFVQSLLLRGIEDAGILAKSLPDAITQSGRHRAVGVIAGRRELTKLRQIGFRRRIPRDVDIWLDVLWHL